MHRTRRVALPVLLLTFFATPSWALRTRLGGIAASDSGPSVSFVVRLNVNTATGAAIGRFRCRPGSGSCILPRGHVAGLFYADGTFTGRVASLKGACDFAGTIVANGLVGRYACAGIRGTDTGAFVLTPF